MEKKNRVNVLLVDDQPGKLLSYEVMLAELDENLVAVSSAKEALAFLLKTEVAVLLVDVCMPELDGFELAKMIRQHPRFEKTAIIFISAIHLSETDYLRGYEAGAVDYISVPVVPQLLRAKVRVFAELFRKTRELQQLNEDLERRVHERTEALESSSSKLRQSEQGRSMALAAGNMGSWGCEFPDGNWLWDEGQSRIFGVDHAGFTPSLERVRQAIHAEDLSRLQQAVENLSSENTSFEIELRVLRPDGEVRWCALAAAGILDGEGHLLRLSGVTTDITERRQAEGRQALLSREVDHRAKNALAVVQSIIRLARRDDVHDYIRAVEGRIGALAQTHELLSQSRWEGADVLRLILEELAPYRSEGTQKVTAIGPSLLVSPENAQTIAMTIHELATNAAKYGALSCQSGRVDIDWSLFEGRLTITWTESGGPIVHPPKVKGFGTKIISSSFGSPDKGRAEFRWRPEGLQCVIELQCDVRAGGTPFPHDVADQTGTKGLALPLSLTEAVQAGHPRVLLVEDELIVGMFMQDLLQDMGFETTDPITRLADAVAAAQVGKFDAAILDMNLNGEIVYPLADLLMRQEVPFVFVTGYSPKSIDHRFAGVPVLQKPIAPDALRLILQPWFSKNSRGKAEKSGVRLQA